VTELAIRALDGVTVISSNDDSVIEALGVLWRPFLLDTVASNSDLVIRVAHSRGKWDFDAGPRGRATHTNSWDVVERASSEVFQTAVRNPGKAIDLHAGVLVSDDGTLLLAGTTGMGKTTLTIRLLLGDAALAYGSDDLAPLESGGAVLPFPKPLVIKDPELWEELKPVEPELMRLGPPAGSFLVPADRFPLPPPGRKLNARSLVFLDRRPGAPSLVEMSSAEAILECGRYVSTIDGERLKIVTRLCSQARCVALGYESWEGVIGLLEGLLAGETRQGL
jgi:hypothetical protein